MSIIGISPSDFIMLGKSIKNLRDTYKQAPSSFVDLTIQLDEFQILLNNVSRTVQQMNAATTPGIKFNDDDEEDECSSVLKGCHASVEDLKKIKAKYSWTDGEGQRVWRRLVYARRIEEGLESRLRQLGDSRAITSIADKQAETLTLQKKSQQEIDKVHEEQQALRKRLDSLTVQDKVDAANRERNLADTVYAVIATYQEVLSTTHAPVGVEEEDAEMDAQWHKLKTHLRRMGFDFSLLSLYEEEILLFFQGLYRKALAIRLQNFHYPKIKKRKIGEGALNAFGIPYKEDELNPDKWVILDKQKSEKELQEFADQHAQMQDKPEPASLFQAQTSDPCNESGSLNDHPISLTSSNHRS